MSWPNLGVGADAPSPSTGNDEAERFFETRVRPVLVAHCYRCHAQEAEEVQGGLLLDTRSGVRKGGERGPAVVPGDVEASLLISAVRYTGPEMPPDGPLPPDAVADLETWVRSGAFDPREDRPHTDQRGEIDFEQARRHWAYRPVRRPDVPTIKDATWGNGPIDTFVMARLEAHGITPSPSADRHSLIRRAFIDLWGLPPTVDEVESFVGDRSVTAWPDLVDRLLASPRYGERWGRHWLDVARYADTKDLVLLLGKDAIRPYAYTYRDYVIRAWNADTPFDQMVREQLAADQLTPPVAPWRLAALGFLTLGRLFDNTLPDIYDDQIDTVARGLLGLTVGCARCHDHKYDAIPTDDYYSLYGVFASCQVPVELPLIGPPAQTPAGQEFEQKSATMRAEFRDFVDQQFRQIHDTARDRLRDYFIAVATTQPDIQESAAFYLSLSPEQLRPQIIRRWRQFFQQANLAADPVFGPWAELMRLADDQYPQGAAAIVQRWRNAEPGLEAGKFNPLVKEALATASFQCRADVAEWYGALMQKHHALLKADGAARPLNELERPLAQLLDPLYGPNSPINFEKTSTYTYMNRADREKYDNTLLELDKLAVHAQDVPARAMVLSDCDELFEPRVFVRGNPARPGKAVPRQFLSILTPAERRPFSRGSGRLDLAEAIVDRANPLTSRVIANRIWLHHFGQPLVGTPNDFGTRGDPPTHPELLDYLAQDLIDHHWSLKDLHRQILLSKTYQQASVDRPECGRVDPDNRLCWRANRRRLDLEAMRDSLLAVSGRLGEYMYGCPVNVTGDVQQGRRTVYGLVDRQDLPGMFRTFDFAPPDQPVGQRSRTTVPQQALFALNSPLIAEQARGVARRAEVVQQSTDTERIAAMYRVVFARAVREGEVGPAVSFIEACRQHRADSQLDPWEQLAQVLLVSNEFMFVD